jgi:hypothetical protein
MVSARERCIVFVNAAKEFYKNYKKTEEISPLVNKAITDEMSAKKLVNKLISEAETVDEKALLGLLPKTGKDELVAAKLTDSLQRAGKTGYLDLNKMIAPTKCTNLMLC